MPRNAKGTFLPAAAVSSAIIGASLVPLKICSVGFTMCSTSVSASWRGILDPSQMTTSLTTRSSFTGRGWETSCTIAVIEKAWRRCNAKQSAQSMSGCGRGVCAGCSFRSSFVVVKLTTAWWLQ